MTHRNRKNLYRAALGLTAILLIAFNLPAFTDFIISDWVAAGISLLFSALIVRLAVRPSIGHVTFLPVVALTIYLALGWQTALFIVGFGSLLATALEALERWRRHEEDAPPWWDIAGRALSIPGRSVISLVLAELAYRAFNAAPPLVQIANLQELLPAVSAIVIFLLVYESLLLLDRFLAGESIRRLIAANYILVLGIHLLPIALAPFAAVAYAALGLVSYFLFLLVMLTIALVVKRLRATQDSLEEQIQRLHAFSTMNRSMRSSLEIDSLMQSAFLQTAGLLKVKNLMVILKKNDGNAESWYIRFYAHNGRRDPDALSQTLDGFTAWVLKERLPLLAESVDQTSQRINSSDPPKARTWMGVPLRSTSEGLGAMVTWLEPGQQPGRAFTQSDMDTFAAIGSQTEVTVENALLFESAQAHAKRLKQLNQISAVMNASLNPDKLQALISESIVEIMGCDQSAIFMPADDENQREYKLVQTQGFSPEQVETVQNKALTLTKAEYDHMVGEGNLLLRNSSKTTLQVAPISELTLGNPAAYALAPLRAQQRSIGILAVYYKDSHDFPDSEAELLDTFANQAALAIINAQIYQQVDVQLARRVGQMVRMSEIGQRLSSTLDMETVFRLIIDSAIEGCNADAGVLVLAGDPVTGGDESKEPHMVAWRGFDPSSKIRAPHRIAEDLASSTVLIKGDPRIISIDEEDGSESYSQLAVPISLEGNVIGAIALESEALNAYTQEDLSFVSQLALQAAVAIRNTQLYRHSQAVSDRLHAILDSTHDGLLMFDPKLRIVMTNTRMEDYWDFARGDFSPPTQDAFIADPISVLGEGLGYKEGELSNLIKKGRANPHMQPQTDLYVTRAIAGQRQRFVERTAIAVADDESNFIGLLLVFRDITDRKELEETRQNLTSMIVHELRSPLQAVMGAMRLISEVTPEDDPIVEQATEVSQRAVKKLLNLVNNLLDLSRMEQGEFVLDPNIEDVRPVVQDTAEELMPLAREVGTVLRVDLPSELPYVRVDKDMIGRVAINLMDNALKYSPPGSLVTIGTSLRKADATYKEDMVVVFVKDNGPGVPEEYREAIFDRYSQIPGRKGRRRSAGLGLAFCKLAVESHGGRIWVANNADGGCTFQFVLPISDAPLEATDT